MVGVAGALRARTRFLLRDVRAMADPRHLDPKVLYERARQRTGPFSPDQLGGLLAANAASAALIFAGWWVTSGLSSAHRQLAWLNLSLLGLVTAGAANGIWLARGRRGVSLARTALFPYPPGSHSASGNGMSMRDDVVAAWSPSGFRPRPPAAEALRAASVARDSEGLVAASNMSRYHRSGCLLVAGKEVRVVARAEHERAGRAACEVCRP